MQIKYFIGIIGIIRVILCLTKNVGTRFLLIR